ncbi:hypothetical protein JVU11DRAFT_6019 [Chiua virens]|nr:hypothetical protein JVU11DRAFT_6019 [Chiua virens]
MELITLILIIIVIILTVVLLSILSLVISPSDYIAPQNKWSRRHEHVVGEEGERLLSDGQEQDGQAPTSGDRDFALTAEIDHWRRAEAKKAEELEIACEDIENLRQDLSIATSQNVELQHQYGTLSRELEGARLFLNTADTFSDSEVIQMLQKLNAELQHTSTFMADHITSVLTLDALESMPRQQSVLDGATETIGSHLVQLLQTARRDDLPLYLQIAFQTHLTRHLCWIISSWTFGKDCNAFVDGIYQRLRTKEQQPISGRWRSLTRAYALSTCVSDPEPFATLIIAGLSDIFFAAGYTFPQVDITPEFSSMFKAKILSAVVLAGRLNQLVAGVLSGDFEVFVVQPGESFQAGIMDEVTDGSRDEVQDSGKGQTVVCTNELGLVKWVEIGTKEKEMRTVVKAKVILESFWDADGL